jgi:hypothetical protein
MKLIYMRIEEERRKQKEGKGKKGERARRMKILVITCY